MKTIAIFNNKGGVGKTTFCANIATHFATTHSKRVLVLDLDPQANITHYMLGADFAGQVVAPYYDRTIDKEFNTIVDAFDKLELGESATNVDIDEIYCDRFQTSLIAGNPFLSSYEDVLSKKWNELSDPDMVSGIMVSNWLNALLQSKSKDYDYAFLDLSPSIGALNRTALLAADYFIAPMSCDIFSLVAIKNIKIWFDKWVNFYNDKYKLFAQEKSHILSKIPGQIKSEVNIDRGFLGYTLQSYISRKNADGKVRTTEAYQRIIDNFEPEIEKHLSPFRKPTIGENGELNLGEIPHMFGILALSQFVAAPITSLNASDGMAGSQYAQAKNYIAAFNTITEKIFANIKEDDEVA